MSSVATTWRPVHSEVAGKSIHLVSVNGKRIDSLATSLKLTRLAQLSFVTHRERKLTTSFIFNNFFSDASQTR